MAEDLRRALAHGGAAGVVARQPAAVGAGCCDGACFSCRACVPQFALIAGGAGESERAARGNTVSMEWLRYYTLTAGVTAICGVGAFVAFVAQGS